jgi:hypothetical protein
MTLQSAKTLGLLVMIQEAWAQMLQYREQ